MIELLVVGLVALFIGISVGGRLVLVVFDDVLDLAYRDPEAARAELRNRLGPWARLIE